MGGVHGSQGTERAYMTGYNGCSNVDAEGRPVYLCLRNDETGEDLEFARCATACRSTELLSSCTGLCSDTVVGAGLHCCESTGSCMPAGAQCPCPDCARVVTWPSWTQGGTCEHDERNQFTILKRFDAIVGEAAISLMGRPKDALTCCANPDYRWPPLPPPQLPPSLPPLPPPQLPLPPLPPPPLPPPLRPPPPPSPSPPPPGLQMPPPPSWLWPKPPPKPPRSSTYTPLKPGDHIAEILNSPIARCLTECVGLIFMIDYCQQRCREEPIFPSMPPPQAPPSFEHTAYVIRVSTAVAGTVIVLLVCCVALAFAYGTVPPCLRRRHDARAQPVCSVSIQTSIAETCPGGSAATIEMLEGAPTTAQPDSGDGTDAHSACGAASAPADASWHGAGEAQSAMMEDAERMRPTQAFGDDGYLRQSGTRGGKTKGRVRSIRWFGDGPGQRGATV